MNNTDEKSQKPLRFCIRLKIVRGQSGGFGFGIVKLLKGVESCGSLNQAAKQMGMAYSNAWTLLNSVERDLGIPLIERKGPKGSSLTTEGKAVLNAFTEMEDAATAAVEKLFANFPVK